MRPLRVPVAMTLTEVLAALEMTKRPRGLYRYEYVRGVEVLFVGSAGECWDWLVQSGLIEHEVAP